VVNCKPHNWEACARKTIFGLKKRIGLPSFKKGDIILFRVSGSNYGVRAIWYFEKATMVDHDVRVVAVQSNVDRFGIEIKRHFLLS